MCILARLDGKMRLHEKNDLGETVVLICGSEIMKNIPPSRDEITILCDQKCIFKWKKTPLNKISSKYI